MRSGAGGAATAYAVVRADAPLHVAPDHRTPVVALPADGFLPFRMLRERDGWAWLETLGAPDESHCATSLRSLEALRLRLYTPLAALVPVTVREITQTFDDDTSVHLARGVPLEPVSGDRLYRLHLGGLRTVLRLDRDAIGTRYLPSAPIERRPRAQVLRGDVLASGAVILGSTGRVTGPPSAVLAVYSHEEGAGDARLEVRPRCGSLRVRVPAHAVQPALPSPLRADPPSPPFVVPGAAVFWANGQRAGMTTAPAAVRDEVAVDGPRDHRCFRHPLGHDRRASRSVVLCFRRRDVVDDGAAAAQWLDAP